MSYSSRVGLCYLGLYGAAMFVLLALPLPAEIRFIFIVALLIGLLVTAIASPWRSVPLETLQYTATRGKFKHSLAKLIAVAQNRIIIVEGWWSLAIYGNEAILDAFEHATERGVRIEMVHQKYPDSPDLAVEGFQMQNGKALEEACEIFMRREFMHYQRIPVTDVHFFVIDNVAVIEDQHPPLDEVKSVRKRRHLMANTGGWIFCGHDELVSKLEKAFEELKATGTACHLTQENGFQR